MSMPQHFFKPWEEIDAELKHGGIPDELAGQFVGADLNDNVTTQNRTIQGLVYDLSQAATAISMHPEAELASFPPQSLVSECLRACDTFVEQMVDVTHTHASKFFNFTHAVPPVSRFKITPIRYPVRNQLADNFLFFAIGTMVELAENNRNSVHKGLDPSAANIIMEALWTFKGDVMKYWFDMEIAGEISTGELEKLYSGRIKPRPSHPDQTSERPGENEVIEALTGLDVFSWVPTKSDWTKFAELQMRRYKPERALQPEGARPVTEDVLPEGPVDAGTGNMATGGPSA